MKLHREADRSVDHDVVQAQWRNHLVLACSHRAHVVGCVLEDEAQRPLLDDEATPHALGNGVGSPETRRDGVLVERPRRPLQRKAVGQVAVHTSTVPRSTS